VVQVGPDQRQRDQLEHDAARAVLKALRKRANEISEDTETCRTSR
jgi:hypothetical protein